MPAPEVAASGAPRRLAAGLLLAAAAAAGGTACAGPERSEAPVEEELYVEVMGRLAAIRAASGPGRGADSLSRERADSLRRSVLAQHGLTRSELKRFARVVGDEPARMEALWKRIGARADSLTEAGWPLDAAAAGADTAVGSADAAAGADPPSAAVDYSGPTGGDR